MKKSIVLIAFLVSSLSVTYGGEGDKIKVLTNDSTSKELVFNVSSERTGSLEIDLSGVQDSLASISLVNQRGSAIFYEFVKENQTHFSFDLSKVKPGRYYVKLNANNEIRMKLIVVA